MKLKYIIPSMFVAAAMLCGCDENDQFKGELYEKVIYVLSDSDHLFSTVHQLGETSEGYVTIYCGGTEHITQDVKVEIEPYEEALDHYNYLNYDLDESRYARLLDKSHYTIRDYSTILSAKSPDYYSLIPIEVMPDGLSPDSTYLIPLRIKSVSDHRVNPDKDYVLYKVLLANEFATMATTTYYQMTGVESLGLASGDVASGISVTRVVAPLSKNKVRMFAGTHSYVPSSVTLDEIDRYAMTVTFNDDHSISIEPYGSLEVEQVGDEEANNWSYNEKGSLIVNLSYRFKDDVTNNGTTENCWVTMTETNVRRATTLL